MFPPFIMMVYFAFFPPPGAVPPTLGSTGVESKNITPWPKVVCSPLPHPYSLPKQNQLSYIHRPNKNLLQNSANLRHSLHIPPLVCWQSNQLWCKGCHPACVTCLIWFQMQALLKLKWILLGFAVSTSIVECVVVAAFSTLMINFPWDWGFVIG